ncbi:MAG: SHOCT domain-containing protein [Candidatus Aenigmatarchaeota archaeon]
MMHWYYGTGAMMFLGPLMWIAGIIVFVLILKWFFQNERSESPVEILKKRYAEGDITKEEYEERKEELLG